MKRIMGLCIMLAASSATAETIRVDVSVMPKVVFTGDSQTCGRVGARDYPQMLSWEMPIRVINTGVGGTNTSHLLSETSGGSAQITKGEKVVKGTKVGWGAGPYPGQKIRLGRHEYVIDRIEVVSHADRQVNLWLTEPAREDFAGGDYAIEAGWRVRVAQHKPDYACFMYSVNDTRWTSEQFRENLKEIVERTRTLGAQPILLSGVPLMDASKGGSHPSGNERVKVREQDLIEFSSQNDIPFGNVFGTLMLLDEPCTAVWVDTVHPTTDGSLAALNALRSIFLDLGLAGNPYYVRGYRAAGQLAAPKAGLVPFTTSQPDYDVNNRHNDNQFNLKAIHVRDEYGLISSADGDGVESETPIVLEFGIGDSQATESVQVEIVTLAESCVAWFDWEKKAWQDLARGRGTIAAGIPKDSIRRACRKGAIWLAVSGDGKIALDYAAVVLGGDVAPFRPKRATGPIVWPRAGELAWQAEDNLVTNGDLTKASNGAPAHWQRQGDQARYFRPGVVAEGSGGFTKGRRIELFKSAGQQFTTTVRPLDMLTVVEGPEGVRGDFLIAQVIDDETVRVRRFPKDEAAGLRFQVTRTSGCGAVPGGCMIESRGGSGWETVVPIAEPGRYCLGFFFRAYDPANMNATNRPGDVASVTVSRGGNALAAADNMEASYQWQRKWLEFEAPQGGQIAIRASAKSDTAVDYAGFTVQKR